MAKVENINGEEVKPPEEFWDNDEAVEYCTHIEDVQKKLAELEAKYKADCSPYRDNIKELFKEAADKGVIKTALQHGLAQRKRERDQEEADARIKPGLLEYSQQMCLALEGYESEAEAA